MTQLKIEKLAYGGEGLGIQNGKVCFVEGALPGEEVLVEITQNKPNFSRAKLLKVLTPSPHRVSPPCIYVDQCGGCQYQHVTYEEELKWKEIQVREYLSRHLKIDESLVKPIQGQPHEYHYRNNLTLHYKNGKTGFIGKDNETFIPISKCLLGNERLQECFEKTGTLKETFRVSAEGEVVSDQQDKIFPVKVGETLLYTHSKSFFQTSFTGIVKIANQLQIWVRQIQPIEFFDLYGGVGTFSVLGSGESKKIICVEENPHSLKALEMNLEVRGLPYEILQGRVEQVFPKYYSSKKFERPFFFLDPPRMGMSERFASFLGKEKTVPGLVYLSCHLGTLTRDLETILKEGNFKISEVIPFDMFPRTKHIEIAVLCLRA